MSKGSTTVWELRAATGNDNNGGGYIPGSSGVDYSQQSSPQYALTGIASGGAGNTILSAAAAADMVGNIAHVVSGTNFTTGFFAVVSVVVGVSITFTTDRGGNSIVTGVGASGVINIGGALATIGILFSASALEAGNVSWCVGTFTITSTFTINTGALGTFTAPGCVIQGYTSVRGDSGRATLTTATNSTRLVTYNNCSFLNWVNFVFSNTATTRAQGHWSNGGNDIRGIGFGNCIFDGLSVGVDGDSDSVGTAIFMLSLDSCEVKNSTVAGIRNGYSTLLTNCYIHDNTGDGAKNTVNQSYGIYAFRCIFYNNTGCGINNQAHGSGARGAVVAEQCVMVSNGSHGFAATDTGNNGPPDMFLQNCILYGNGGFGFYLGNTPGNVYGHSNAFGANTSGARGGNAPAFTGDINLTGDPFTNKSGGDFSLNATSGAGAACKGTGFPGTMIGGGTGTASITALDPSSGGGSTTNIIVAPQVTIFMAAEGEQ